MNAATETERVAVGREYRLFFIALAVVALAVSFRFGIGGSLASTEAPAAVPSPQSAVPTEQTVPMHAASARDDLGPGQAEPILVGSP